MNVFDYSPSSFYYSFLSGWEDKNFPECPRDDAKVGGIGIFRESYWRGSLTYSTSRTAVNPPLRTMVILSLVALLTVRS